MSTSSDDTSDSGTATPPRYSRILDIPPEDGPQAAEIVSTLVDADGITDSQRNSTHAAEDTFHVIERDEVQPPFDSVPVIPDNDSHSTLSRIPPMPVPVVPVFTITDTDQAPPIAEKLPTVHEGDIMEANIALPPQDDRTLPPPADELDNVAGGDIPDRKSFASEITQPESILTGGRDSLITRANLLREEANKAEKRRKELDNERKTLVKEGDVKGAFLLKEKIEELETLSKKLHQKAERRYYKVYNEDANPTTIDVHQLTGEEAVRRTEKAIRDMLLQGGSKLRVVTAGKVIDTTSTGEIVPGVYSSIIKAMQEQKIHAEQDQEAPGIVNITLPFT
jgi:hypothetical protein